MKMERNLSRVSSTLAILGLLVSVYMTVYKLTDIQTMCLGNGGCSVVNNSPYSEVYGVPVALVGALGYATILAVLTLSGRWPILRANAALVVFGLCLAGFLFTLYLIYVEIAVIHALCPFCLASQAIMTLLFAAAVMRLIREPID
jgi:uncharacterized membrane protein